MTLMAAGLQQSAQATRAASGPAMSGSLLDPLLASGKLVSSTGSALANAKVHLLMWPSDDVVANMAEGDAANLVTVATATTDPTGGFGIRLADLSGLLLGAGLDDIIDFTLIATDANGEVAHYAFSREVVTRVVNDTVRTLFVDPLNITEGLEDLLAEVGNLLNLVVPAKNVLLKIGDGGSRTTTDPDDSTADDPAPDDPGVEEPIEESVPETQALVVESDEAAIGDKSCYVTSEKVYSPRTTLVGQHGSSSSYATGDFTYTSGATSTLGVGVSSSGSYGSFKSSGTNSKSSTGSQGYAARAGKGYWGYRTLFKVSKFRYYCAYPGAAGVSFYETRSTGWASGATTAIWGSSQLPSATKCTPQEAGADFTKSTSTAITWSNGLDTSGVIGLDLSARTGYETDAKIFFDFPTVDQRLCGTADYPGGTPRVLVAKPKA